MSHTPGTLLIDPWGYVRTHGAHDVLVTNFIVWRGGPGAHMDEARANTVRLIDCWNACAGLTPEQVAAVPRLVAWYRGTPAEFAKHEQWMTEWRELDRIFKVGDQS